MSIFVFFAIDGVFYGAFSLWASLIFLWAANISVDSQCLLITNLMEPWMGQRILNHFVRNNCPQFRNGLQDSYFFKLTLESVPLELFEQSLSTPFYQKKIPAQFSALERNFICFKPISWVLDIKIYILSLFIDLIKWSRSVPSAKRWTLKKLCTKKIMHNAQALVIE